MLTSLKLDTELTDMIGVLVDLSECDDVRAILDGMLDYDLSP